MLEALQRLDPELKLDVKHFPWGSDYYRKHGVMMPDDGLAALRNYDAIYFGAVGAPDVPKRALRRASGRGGARPVAT